MTSSLLPGRLAGPGLLGRGDRAQSRPADRLIQLPLGNPGRCSDDPTLTIIISDDSGSVTGGNDPIGKRYLEAGYALDKVARRCRCGRDLAAVIHFDVPTSADVPPIPIARKGRHLLDDGLRTPPEAASSNLGPSLRSAYQMAAEHPEHQATLVVASDFQLFDDDVPRVLEELAAFPGTVHVVCLRAAPPARLVDDPQITVTNIDYTSQPGAVARAIFDSLTLHRPGRRPATPTSSRGRR